jgi:hypothetical protein
MNRAAAHEILDRARDGQNIGTGLICLALRATGDIPWIDTIQLRTAAGEWELEADTTLMQLADPFEALRAVVTG